MDALGPGDSDPVIEVCAKKLGVVPATEEFSELLAQRIRGLQSLNGLELTGVLDEEVLKILKVGDGNEG